MALPDDAVRMVVAQPFPQLTNVEPCRWLEPGRAAQLQAIETILRLSRGAVVGTPRAHFTVLPEYCIPGLPGIAAIQRALEDASWPASSVVIGGSDGLSRAEFAQLAAEPRTMAPQGWDSRLRATEWVNCGIIWVKSSAGVERWLQPKLHPAREELDVLYQDMYRGDSVFLFNAKYTSGVPCNFAALVCFDWIARIGGKQPWRWLLDDMAERVRPNATTLSWLFVIARNKKPPHWTFLSEIRDFFNPDTVQEVRRDRTCLVLANCAGKSALGGASEFGLSSLVYSQQANVADPRCARTYSTGRGRYHEMGQLRPLKGAYFRERGACVHVFSQPNPVAGLPGPGSLKFPLEDAAVFPLDGVSDRRAPSAPVDATTKWLNDALESVIPLSAQHPEAALAGAAQVGHVRVSEALREVEAARIDKLLRLASSLTPPADDNASDGNYSDDWDSTETAALSHAVDSLVLLGLAMPGLRVAEGDSHGAFPFREDLVDVVAVVGEHHHTCELHAREKFVAHPRRQVLLVSRDRNNTERGDRDGNFLRREAVKVGDSPKITDPASGWVVKGYQRFLSTYIRSADATALGGGVHAEIA